MPLNLGHDVVIGRKSLMKENTSQLNNLSNNRVKGQGMKGKNTEFQRTEVAPKPVFAPEPSENAFDRGFDKSPKPQRCTAKAARIMPENKATHVDQPFQETNVDSQTDLVLSEKANTKAQRSIADRKNKGTKRPSPGKYRRNIELYLADVANESGSLITVIEGKTRFSKTRSITKKRKRAAKATEPTNESGKPGLGKESNSDSGSKSDEKRKTTIVQCVKNGKDNTTTISHSQSSKESKNKKDNGNLVNAKKSKEKGRGIYHANIMVLGGGTAEGGIRKIKARKKERKNGKEKCIINAFKRNFLGYKL